ncbi:MAG: hypothetical protein RQ875_06895 [Vicingaceae bacterium]|nr:hypothetical protein [Vicingaceae bacterium]
MIKTLKIIQSSLLTSFGIVSVFMTLSVIFNWFGIREKEGNYVLFIVYTNLICGIIYLYAAYINWKKQLYNLYSLVVASIILISAFIALQVYANNGGIHEVKTIKAMLFRIGFTAFLTAISFFILKKSNQHKPLKQ